MIIFPLVLLIQLTPTTQQLIISMGFAVCLINSFAVIFGPKILMLMSGKDINAQLQVVDRMPNPYENDIKKSKVQTSDEYTYYIAAFDCFNGEWTLINTRDLLLLPESAWYSNPQWEGALCYTVPKEQMTEWDKPNLFTV